MATREKIKTATILQELRKLTAQELEHKIKEERENLYQLRRGHAMEPVSSSALFRKKRKFIAQLLTVKNQTSAKE